MNFESEIRQGRLVVSKCDACKVTVWPPSGFCSRCLGMTSWKDAQAAGTVLEYSKKDESYFCVVEMHDSFRVIGRVASGTPKIGQKAELQKCGIRDGAYFFEFELC